MEDFLIYILKFILFYLFVYGLYLLITIKKRKEFNPDKSSKEVLFLVSKYKLNFEKVSYKKFSRSIIAYNSFILVLAVFVTEFFDTYLMKILIAFMLIFPLVLFGYSFIGKCFKKKGDK